MNTQLLRGFATAALAIVLFFTGGSEAPVGPEPTDRFVATPRITVSNDYGEAVEVWMVSVDNRLHLELGSVPAHATRTFQLRRTRVPLKFVVLPAGTEEDRYVSRVIVLGETTTVRVRIAPRLQASLEHVSEQEVVPCCRERYTGPQQTVTIKT